MTKDYAVKRLQTIVNHSGDAYDYEIKVRNWENYGKSRTYLSIVETSKTSKHYVERKYGYIDNQTGEYIPEKNDLNDNFTFSGSRFVEEAEEAQETKVSENMTSADMVEAIEQIVEKFEEVQKNSPQIEQIKAMHQKIISNIKGTDGGQVKRDFRQCVYGRTGKPVDDWKKFIYSLDRAAKDGRDYRK